MNDAQDHHEAASPARLRIVRPAQAGAVLELAARELAEGLGAMLAGKLFIEPANEMRGAQLVVATGMSGAQTEPVPARAGYAINPQGQGIVLSGADERSVLDAVYHLLRDLGAGFPLGAPADFPRVDPARLAALKPVAVQAAFTRRCLVSDIMTWHYEDNARFAMHLAHDREFIPWMARSGINAFFYIRHAFDTRYRIEEIEGLHRERGIEVEYGGHVIQQLLPREHFAAHPEYFPAAADGARMQMGNLCVASPGAMTTVRNGAVDYLLRHPDTRLLHVWGADVKKGAWCLCERCREVAPQLQYLKIVNAIAAVAAGGFATAKTPPAVAYLAYHDTLSNPCQMLEPLNNVW